MKLILKYLKPFWLTVLLVVVFTFVQVQTELALPDYMSDIVTNGIQYQGITDAVPGIVKVEDMEVLKSFMSESDYKFVIEHYDLVKGNETVELGQRFETSGDAYLINSVDERLADILKNPLVYSYIAKSGNLELTEQNKEIIRNQAVGLSDSYDSIVKISVANLYKNAGFKVESSQTNYILKVGGIMLAVSLLSVLVQLISTYLATKTASRIALRLRRDVFAKVESFSSSEFSKFSTSSLITRTGNDITKVQQLIQMMMRMMLMAPMMGFTAVFKVMRYPSVAWVLLVAVGAILCLLVFLLIVAVPKFEVVQKLVDKINAVMREALDGNLVIRAFNGQERQEKKFDEVNSSLTKVDRFVSRMVSIAPAFMTFLMNALTIAIIWFSAKQIDMEVMTVGDMMAFVQYAMHVIMSFMFVTMMFFMIPRSLVSARRISEVLDTKNTILDKEETKELPKSNGVLEFDRVSFKYPGAEEYVLKDVSFKVNPGETLAIIGSTGSGKSTIVKLIPRLFDVTDGAIRYCGEDIRDVKQSELHERIGFASQKAILFSGDIKSNIEFGRDVTAEELNKAIDISQSRNIVSEKEEGVESPITQGGTNVSGGQKQRLSIARTLAKAKSLYIFDDTFSALDYATDRKLRSELNKVIKETQATVIIVAQRIATIKNADKIVVLDSGMVVGMGKHSDLLRDCKVYQEIAYSQLSKEELEYAAN